MTRATIALVLLAFAWPAMAQAQAPQTNAPPGNSAVDEYLETVPGAGGNQRPRNRPPSGTAGGALSATQRARLERLGPDGKTLADAVETTAPVKQKAPEPKLEPESAGGSPTRELLNAVTGDDGGGGGMGLILPAIMIAALLATIMVVVLRRRASSS